MKVLLIALPLAMGACAPRSAAPAMGAASSCPTDTEGVAWLLGTWSGSRPDGATYEEVWVRDGVRFVGTHVERRGDEVEFTEQLKVQTVGPALFYAAWPEGAAQATPFACVDAGAMRITFENTAHDWPTAIAYEREGDALQATASGGDRGATWSFTLAAEPTKP